MKYIESHTVEKEEEIYCTKISYIEPIFEGGLQVNLILIWFILVLSFPKVAIQLYLIYVMNTKVDKSPFIGHFLFLDQDRGFLDFRSFAYDEENSW